VLDRRRLEMTYILTIWLIVSNQLVGIEVRIPASANCAMTAEATAAANDMELVSFKCVLEVDA
jgi:hypothetical protein